jgi:aminopeptidase
MAEHHDVINDRTTNWCVVPWATEAWARRVHTDLPPDEALAKLWDELVFVLRLDEPDAGAAWVERATQLHEAGTKLDAAHLDALRFDGPGTDLTVGLLPTSRFAEDAPGSTNLDGINFHPNLPSEEVFTTPDPLRTEGVVTATKPLDLGGTVVRGLKVRFEGGRAVQIDADEGADALRARCAKDEGASRLGEVALVDREGRIGKTGTVFFNTLLDENAASHMAFGNAYASAVGKEDVPRMNASEIHVDFMIGGNEVAVTGLTADGREVPVLREGAWQL